MKAVSVVWYRRNLPGESLNKPPHDLSRSCIKDLITLFAVNSDQEISSSIFTAGDFQAVSERTEMTFTGWR
jgi:hypothetical protein